MRVYVSIVDQLSETRQFVVTIPRVALERIHRYFVGTASEGACHSLHCEGPFGQRRAYRQETHKRWLSDNSRSG